MCSMDPEFLLFSVICYNVVAQPKTIDSWQIGISFHNTTNLIFPFAIKSVDRGSSAVLVQKAKGVENILQVKAGKKEFEFTNLSVVTTDGKFYSFLVDYDSEPSNLNISFVKNDLMHPVQISGQRSESELEGESYKAHGTLRFMGIRKNH